MVDAVRLSTGLEPAAFNTVPSSRCLRSGVVPIRAQSR